MQQHLPRVVPPLGDAWLRGALFVSLCAYVWAGGKGTLLVFMGTMVRRDSWFQEGYLVPKLQHGPTNPFKGVKKWQGVQEGALSVVLDESLIAQQLAGLNPGSRGEQIGARTHTSVALVCSLEPSALVLLGWTLVATCACGIRLKIPCISTEMRCYRDCCWFYCTVTQKLLLLVALWWMFLHWEFAPSPASPLSCAQRGQGGCWGWEIDAGAFYRALGGVHRNEARSSLFLPGAWTLRLPF